MFCCFRGRRKTSIAPESRHVPCMNSVSVAPSPDQLQSQDATAVNQQKMSLFCKKIRLHLTALYHWTTCVFIISLVCSQLLGAFSDSKTTTEHLFYGNSPLKGPSQIIGTNDIPYPDRVIACVRKGQFYEPKLVSSLLNSPGISSILEDSSGSAKHGYRLRKRRGSTNSALDSITQEVYESSCSLISKTMDNIFHACLALGYSDLVRDNLRVLDDWNSKNLYFLPDTLPVLILPYWDNSPYARHVIPTWRGDACIFRLEDAYSVADNSNLPASFRGVDQNIHHNHTMQWLNRPGGAWWNGWYEDLDGIRWYSDLKSSWPGPPYNMMHRLFDMRSGEEIDCSEPDNCEAEAHVEQWGDKFSSSNKGHRINSVFIANGTEFGFSLYESHEIHTVRSMFDWETLISNVSVGLVLSRWVLSLVSLHSGGFGGGNPWFSSGIGCVSGAGSFALLPLASLPRLKMTLAAFWTVGCRFEGQQIGLSEAWFAIYPAIVNFVLIYFSLLNLAAKALRRRMSDVLFAPTVIFLCLLHYFRLELAASGWLKGVDGRIVTVVFSDEAKKLQLVDYFTTGIAWRMNGRVTLIFGLKLALIGVNMLPLLLCRSFPLKRPANARDGVEKALALRVNYVGGLGRSLTYTVIDHNQVSSWYFTSKIPKLENAQKIVLVNSYELIRLGYIVFGDKYLMSFDEWELLSSMAPFRDFFHLWNHRVLVWTLRPDDVDGAGGRALESVEPQMWRLDDHRLQKVRWWQVSACGIQC